MPLCPRTHEWFEILINDLRFHLTFMKKDEHYYNVHRSYTSTRVNHESFSENSATHQEFFRFQNGHDIRLKNAAVVWQYVERSGVGISKRKQKKFSQFVRKDHTRKRIILCHVFSESNLA